MKYKGKVKSIIGSGAAFIVCDELKENVYCREKFVTDLQLKEGDQVEFDCKKDTKGFSVTNLEKVEDSLNPLFDLGLRIDKLTDEEYDKFCELCRNYVEKKDFKKNVTTSKIRNIFSPIKSAKNVKEIKLLRPKLAYLAGKDSGTKPFMNDLDKVIKSIKTENEVKNFKALFEAIVCYKKALE